MLFQECSHYWELTTFCKTRRVYAATVTLSAVSCSIIAEGKPADLRDHSTGPRMRQFFNHQRDAGWQRGSS